MDKISREDLLRLADMSRLHLDEDEISGLIQQIQSVLNYAERVTTAVQNRTIRDEPSSKNINIFREDVAVQTDAEPILAQAPEREGDFFVVPVIIENK